MSKWKVRRKYTAEQLREKLRHMTWGVFESKDWVRIDYIDFIIKCGHHMGQPALAITAQGHPYFVALRYLKVAENESDSVALLRNEWRKHKLSVNGDGKRFMEPAHQGASAHQHAYWRVHILNMLKDTLIVKEASGDGGNPDASALTHALQP